MVKLLRLCVTGNGRTDAYAAGESRDHMLLNKRYWTVTVRPSGSSIAMCGSRTGEMALSEPMNYQTISHFSEALVIGCWWCP